MPLHTLRNIEINSPSLVKKVKESQLFKQHFDGKPIKLENHKGGVHKGHTESQHVSKGSLDNDMKFLVDRRVSEDLKIASMYPSKEVAEKVITEILLKKEKDIVKWVNNPNSNPIRQFSAGFDFNVGYGIRKGNNGLEFFDRVTIVLEKTKDGIKIKTSHPDKVIK